MVDAVLVLLCVIERPTVLYCPLKPSPVVRWTTMVMESDVRLAVLASFRSSSLK